MESKKLLTEAQKRAQKKYYEKIKTSDKFIEARKINMRNYHNKNKDDEEYKQLKRDQAKQYYNENREKVLNRVAMSRIKIPFISLIDLKISDTSDDE